VKKLISYCFFLLVSLHSFSQYYIRGNVRDEKNNALQNAKIFLLSTRLMYTAGSDGSFGISTPYPYDSLTVSMDGYETQTMRVKADSWQNIVLKVSSTVAARNRPRLISISKDHRHEGKFNAATGDETYFKLIENAPINTADFPNTGFSLNVNKASYSNVRRFINMGSKVPPDAVRTEELVNYFNLDQDYPEGKEMFKIKSSLTSCPWNAGSQLLFINVNAKKIDLENVPPGNFVFLIDVSGSMDMPNRLPLLKAAFQLFAKNLRAVDKVSIVIYGGSVAVWLQPTAGNETTKICKAIEALEAAGDTPGERAIQTAYKVAESSFIIGGNNRIILATDGDFNVGQSSEKALDELITKERQSGVYLTCLGVGMGNFKDSKLQTLAKRGNGNYAYLDDLHEAEKVLVYELAETLYAVADNTFLNINFDPAMVKRYRLVGFDNKKDAIAEPDNELEGGEIGSGSSTTAIFEIVPANEQRENYLADISIRFHDHSDTNNVIKSINYKVPAALTPLEDASKCTEFAAAVALYGLKLRDSKYINNISWESISKLANAAADPNNYLQADFLKLLDKTIGLYDPNSRKKNKKKKK
jgi:Ca-activated chloride channel family protein